MHGAGKQSQRAKRTRTGDRFEVGGQWLGQESGIWHRYWYDAADGRGRRKSLGTRDFEEAKLALFRIVTGEPASDVTAPNAVLLSAAFAYYLEHRGKVHRPARVALRLILEYMKSATGGSASMVADFNLTRQQGFMRWAAERNLKARSIGLYLDWAKAALNYAATPMLFTDSRGQEREGQLLSSAPKVFSLESYVSKVTGLPAGRPRHWLPTDKELAQFLDQIQGDGLRGSAEAQNYVFRYCVIALCTGARPQAILELNVAQQVDFSRGLIDLNQPGRRQTKKRRPTIRLCDTLRGWLLHWAEEYPINYRGAELRSMKAVFRRVARKTGLSSLTPYTLRHYWATRIKTSGVYVEREQRAAWMGHVDPDHRTTEHWYESFDPEFLEAPMRATDAMMAALNVHTAKSLYAPGAVPGTRLTVIEEEIQQRAIR
jgi:integrase